MQDCVSSHLGPDASAIQKDLYWGKATILFAHDRKVVLHDSAAFGKNGGGGKILPVKRDEKMASCGTRRFAQSGEITLFEKVAAFRVPAPHCFGIEEDEISEETPLLVMPEN